MFGSEEHLQERGDCSDACTIAFQHHNSSGGDGSPSLSRKLHEVAVKRQKDPTFSLCDFKNLYVWEPGIIRQSPDNIVPKPSQPPDEIPGKVLSASRRIYAKVAAGLCARTIKAPSLMQASRSARAMRG